MRKTIFTWAGRAKDWKKVSKRFKKNIWKN